MEGKTFKQRYQLKEKLGSGRLGDVYLADDLQVGRQVAVKTLYSQVVSDAAYIEKLEAELKVASALDQPNIVKTIDWGREDDLYFVVTDFVDGRSLKDFLATGGKLPADRAAKIASDTCRALALAHSRGLVHGGLSTNNIFIDEIGEVKVMDIGMAWTASGRGTPQYIAPEQAQRLAVDARTDIYSLGIVLYEMLTGKVPFDDPDSQVVLREQISEEPVAPAVIDPSIPAALNAIVMEALAKDPAARFQSAQEMHDALVRFREALAPAPAAAPAAAAAAPRAEKKGTPAWVWWMLGILGILVVAGIVLAIVLTGGGGEETVAVPNVVGLTEDEARQALDDAGLKMQKEDSYITSENQPTGVVVSQDPAQGSSANKGGSVTVDISTELRMPNVVGLSQSEAESTLKRQEISTIQISNTPVLDPAKVGTVVEQTPAGGTLISPGTSVSLQIGEESEAVLVPNVVGLEQNEAETKLKDADLKVKVEEQQSSVVQPGIVISQNPSVGQQVEKGTEVTIVVAVAPPT
jgi:beta-lactam-binding protein with PASTA domain